VPSAISAIEDGRLFTVAKNGRKIYDRSNTPHWVNTGSTSTSWRCYPSHTVEIRYHKSHRIDAVSGSPRFLQQRFHGTARHHRCNHTHEFAAPFYLSRSCRKCVQTPKEKTTAADSQANLNKIKPCRKPGKVGFGGRVCLIVGVVLVLVLFGVLETHVEAAHDGLRGEYGQHILRLES